MWKRLTAVVTGAVLTAAGAGVAGPVHAAAAPVSVAVDSPAAGASVAGSTVQVTYTVTSAPGEVVGYVGAKLVNDYQQRYLGTTCESGCTVTATFDTTAAPPPPGSPFNADYADGTQTLSVTASTTDGQSANLDVGVVLDNHRPTEQLGAPQPDPRTSSDPYTATSHFHLEVYPTANDGGSIVAVTFHYLTGGAQQTAALSPPASPGQAWTLDLDSSAWPSGPENGWVTSTDERGVSSLGTMVYLVVDHGFTLTGPSLSSPVDDFTVDEVQLNYSHMPTSDTFPVHVATYLDGNIAEQHSLLDTDTGDPPGVITATTGSRTPGGSHALRYVVTDNRGVSEEVDYQLNVTSTLTTAWTGGVGQSFLPGALALAGTADSTGPPITGWTFSIDGQPLASWNCPAGTTCPTHVDAVDTDQRDPETYTPGQHRVSLEVATADGLPQTVTGTITVLPYAHAQLAPHAATTYGHAFTLTGHVVLTGGAPAPGARVAVQRRGADASGTWRTVATGTADATGAVQVQVTAARSSQYRMVTATDPAQWQGRAGNIRTVASHADLHLIHAPATGRLNRYVTVRGVVAPARPHDRVILEQETAYGWLSAGRVRPDASGAFALRYRLVRPTVRLRVVRPASYLLLVATSPPWRLRSH